MYTRIFLVEQSSQLVKNLWKRRLNSSEFVNSCRKISHFGESVHVVHISYYSVPMGQFDLRTSTFRAKMRECEVAMAKVRMQRSENATAKREDAMACEVAKAKERYYYSFACATSHSRLRTFAFFVCGAFYRLKSFKDNFSCIKWHLRQKTNFWEFSLNISLRGSRFFSGVWGLQRNNSIAPEGVSEAYAWQFSGT